MLGLLERLREALTYAEFRALHVGAGAVGMISIRSGLRGQRRTNELKPDLRECAVRG
jgi:hypothetical protein